MGYGEPQKKSMAAPDTGKKWLLADFSNEEFPTIQEFPHPSQTSVMPVVAVRDNEIRPLGTCFAVSNHGIALTARHVLDEAVKLNDGAQSSSQSWQLAAVYVALSIDGQEATKLLGGLIPARSINFNRALDIAAIHLSLPTFRETGKPLEMPAFRLSPGLPEPGSLCFGLGYHSMAWHQATDNIHTHTVAQSYSASRGQIDEVHFPSRDSSLLNFPCFQTSARFEGGMSGGPVLNSSGTVIGVVCSSLYAPAHSTYISYCSLVGPSLLIQMDGKGGQENVVRGFLYDFCIGGSVPLDHTIESIICERGETSLTLDFGKAPLLVNRIKSSTL